MSATDPGAERQGANDPAPVIRDEAPPMRIRRKGRRRVATPWDTDLVDSWERFQRDRTGWKSQVVAEGESKATRDKVYNAARSLGLHIETSFGDLDPEEAVEAAAELDVPEGTPLVRLYFRADRQTKTYTGKWIANPRDELA